MQDIERQIAQKLLQINAIKLDAANGFTWASGIQSPIYCDNRRTLAYPEVRGLIRDGFAAVIRKQYPDTEYVAGVATGAIAHGMLAADALGLPFIYVRPKPKDHGLANQIEGVVEPGRRVVVVEDLVSTGGSSLQAVDALRNAGYQVLGLVAIFTYGFDAAREAFAKAQCRFGTLTNYAALLQVAVDGGYVTRDQAQGLEGWRATVKF